MGVPSPAGQTVADEDQVVGRIVIGRLPGCGTDDQGNHGHKQEHVEENLGDLNTRASDAAKAEHRSDERKDEKCNGPF